MKFWNFKNLENKKAELYLNGEIVSEKPWCEENYCEYKEFISELNNLGDCNNIDVFINSFGGDVFAAVAIYSQLKKHIANINIIISGICASAATIVAMAGDTIKMVKGSVFMIHNPSVGLVGYFDKDKLDKVKNSIEAVKKAIIEAYQTRIDKSEEELAEFMDKETYFTAEEAFANGIIDEVIGGKIDVVMDEESLSINNLSITAQTYKNFSALKTKLSKKTAPKGAFFNKKNKEDLVMNVSELEQKYPELIKEIRDSAKEEAVMLERKRLKAIDEIAENLPKEMVEQAKYVDVVSAEQLAYKAVVANKQLAESAVCDRISDNLESNVKNVVPEGQGTSKDENSVRLQRVVDFMNKDGRRL